MAIREQTYSISCKGGVDKTSNTQELLKMPNIATRLINFESSVDGGYRRINGYRKLGTGSMTAGGREPIHGIHIYNNGYVITKSSSIYFSYDGVGLIQLNKSVDYINNPDGVDYTTMQAAPLLPRPASGHYSFQVFNQGLKTILVGCCPNNKPFYAVISGTTLENSTYLYKELNLTTGTLTGASMSVKYKDQYVIAGMDSAPYEIYYSDILKPDNFEGANAGAIGFNDEVVGLKMFRKDLYVFCTASIHRVVGLESGNPARESLTEQIGCVDGNSIQEVGGDLVFLSPDGLRTLSATQRLGDMNLTNLSKNIGPTLKRGIADIDKYEVRSVVIKSRAQYRLFFTPKEGERVAALGFIMFMSPGNEGVVPEFSEIKGFNIASIYNGYKDGKEVTVSGDFMGNFYFHDSGPDLDGTPMTFLYQTPYFDMGDSAYRKNIHKVITYLNLEGDSVFNIQVKYDFEDPSSYSPPPHYSGKLVAPAIYDEVNYKTSNAKYSSIDKPKITTLTEGSGKTVALRIFPTGEACDPFNIQGFDLYYLPGGRI